MSARWLIVFLIWAIPIASIVACPYDLHGTSTCSEAAQLGLTISFYLAMPGLAFGGFLSSIVQDDPYGGASFVAVAIGAVTWLALLSAMVIWGPGWLRRYFVRGPARRR
jgi:hypothetical protein